MPIPRLLTGKASDFLKIGLAAAGRGDLETLKYVLREQPNWYRQVGSHGRTMLWEAAYRDREETVDYLLETYSDIDLETRGCYYTPMLVEISPLCAALYKKRIAVVSKLESAGGRYDAVSMSYLGDLDSLQATLDATPSVLNTEFPQHDPQGPITLLHYAVAGNHDQVVSWLIQQGSHVEPYSERLVKFAINRNSPSLVQQLFDAGVDLSNQSLSLGNIDNQEIAELLQSHGVLLDVNATDHGWPALVYVCRGDRGGNPKEVKRLLDQGADVNIRNQKNQTALHCAAKAGFAEATQLLLDNGADPNLRDSQGDTPLHAACASTIKDSSKLQAVIDLLLDAKADKNLKNKREKTPEDIASRKRKHRLLLDS